MLSHVCFARKYAFFFSRLVLVSSFCGAFLGSGFWKGFLTFLILIRLNLKTWEIFLALINLILGWSLYLPSIFKIGSCSDECGHLYPLLVIFKIEIFLKYSLNLLAIWSSQKIILSSSTKLRLECFVTFLDKWFDNFSKSSVISHNLSIKTAIKILFLIS